MKNKLIYLTIVLSVGSISINSIYNSEFNEPNYEEFTKIDNAFGIYDISDGYVYFGRDNCPVCNIFAPVLDEVALEMDAPILYYDTEDFKSYDDFGLLMDEYEVEEVPYLIYIDNGLITKSYQYSTFGSNYDIDDEGIDILKSDIKAFMED